MPERTPTARCQVSVAARISQSLATALHERFTHVSVTRDGKGLVVEGLDQAALRAFVNSLWDAGVDVCTVAVDPLCTDRPGFADEVTVTAGEEMEAIATVTSREALINGTLLDLGGP